MPKYEIEGEIYDAASPDEAYNKHENAQLIKAARARGAQMSPVAQGALTAAQGATFNFADELAGLAGPQYREQVRGATQEFARQRPMTAAGLEIAGGLATAPLTGPLSMGRGMTTMGNIARTGVDLAAQGALAGAGAAEGGAGDRLAGAGMGAGAGVLVGGGANVLGRTASNVIGRPIASRLPQGVMGMVPETAGGYNVRPDYARERLAELLERDARARILGEVPPGQEAVMAGRRLQKLGGEAPIASAGQNTLAEIDMLANMPGSASKLLTAQQRRVAKERGGALTETAQKITGIARSAEDELMDLAKRQGEAAGPLYQQLQNVQFPIDKDLKGILDRAKLDLGGAQRTATRRGEPSVPVRKLKEGDALPFPVADQLKRTLWDKAEAARRAGKNNEAADLDRLRLDLVGKLDTLSPDYAKARQTFAGFAELQTAVDRGRSALSETAESLSKLTGEMTPSELEAFQVGAVDALRQVAGSQGGQTRLLNMYKEPELQGKLRAIFGNDFRKFQSSVLKQEELKKLERQGGGSQTFRRQATAQDQAEAFDFMQAAAQGSPMGAFQYVQQKARQYGMPETERDRLARLLMLRDQPAQSELRNMQEYMQRRARGQALGRQAAGRVGAFGAGQD